jgi:hypothetical protein
VGARELYPVREKWGVGPGRHGISKTGGSLTTKQPGESGDILLIRSEVNLIQQIRLIHAIAESDFGVALESLQEAKFQILKERFGLKFAPHSAYGVDIADQIELSHTRPCTSIGSVSRPLIFPRAVVEYCRTLWPERRQFRYSFQGLLTPPRQQLLQQWIHANLPAETFRIPKADSLISRLQKAGRSVFGMDNTREWRLGNLLVCSSDRGRTFPVKAWDEEYFRILAGSEFVLCPSGDCVWSYRVFEAILCGAIPIAEKECPAYEGFRDHYLADKAAGLKWSLEDAEHNYRVCVAKLTVPKITLNEELGRIISLKAAN